MRYYICANCDNVIDSSRIHSRKYGTKYLKCLNCMLVGLEGPVWRHTMKKMTSVVQDELERMYKEQEGK